MHHPSLAPRAARSTPAGDWATDHPQTVPTQAALDGAVEAACAQACRSFAPAWPLDQAIAVNPHWARIDRPVRQVAARLAVLAGVHVFPPRPLIAQAWAEGRITPQDLRAALAALGHPTRAEAECLQALQTAPDIAPLPLLIDVLDDDPQRHERLSWRQAITHQLSQTCAAYFDHHQADWQPERSAGLFDFWRDGLTHDHGVAWLMGLPTLRCHLHALPGSRQEVERWALQRQGLDPAIWADYLESVLWTVPGWASWCAYLGWQARQQGREDGHLRDLLAIRLAWGALLLECKADASGQRAGADLSRAWREAPARLARAEQALWVDEVWQLALEQGYQRGLASRLSVAAAPLPEPAPEVQAVFCIDVRSERMRRALEAVWPAVQTRGFAGFFGLPAAYTPLGTALARPHLPGLLAPTVAVGEVIEDAQGHAGPDDAAAQAARARRRGLDRRARWEAAGRWPGAAFSYVEAAGLGYLGRLAGWLQPHAGRRADADRSGLPARYRPLCRPTLGGLDLPAEVDLAARVLRGMGLDRGTAPLVLLVGHGSQSANNAQAAALDCGACCGQTGEVSVRALARLLNRPEVRQGLAERGLVLGEDTRFIAALHNTATDEMVWYDLDQQPAATCAALGPVQAAFEHAADQVRRERAPSLGLAPTLPAPALLNTLRRRANDGAQTRPEWGLSGNAALVIAPRHRTRGVLLDGRAFLHDYDAEADPQGQLLTQLMTAPMLVAHWINWQYHAAVCEPERLGSGNKLLHNVVGGRIGVFEGNGGDLRIGLARQSVHDGQRWMHEPLRLTVVIDAPAAAIEQVLATQEVVRQLVENGWLHLWRFGETGSERYQAGRWLAVPDEAPARN
ncbi:YbcC family protein [Ideonella dechloratans]|uniref:YbcC family protein n=1 Tax=Ideonella dechloratans TaxID=36863 RepID=UPI0035B21171